MIAGTVVAPALHRLMPRRIAAISLIAKSLRSRVGKSITRNAIAEELWPILNEEPQGKLAVVGVLIQVRKMLEHRRYAGTIFGAEVFL